MRVAYLSVSSQIGGSEVVLLDLMRALARSRPNWELHLIAPAQGPLVDRGAAAGAEVTLVEMPVFLRRLGEGAGGSRAEVATRFGKAAWTLPTYEHALANALRAIAPDIVHSNGLKTHVAAARVRPLPAPLVWHLHEYVGSRPITRTLLSAYARRCAGIVANSESVARDVAEAIGPKVPVRVILNGVDLGRFAPAGERCDLDAAAAAPAAPPRTIRVGLIATFSRWKGHETFLRAIADLPSQLPVRAYVIGAPIYDTVGSQHTEAELRQLASDIGVADRVYFTGFVSDIENVMRALDIVVHASTRPEPFGLAVAEAMACGRPVITSASGGVAELVRDGVDGLTHPPGDHATLAARIATLAADGRLRARLGYAAHATARQRFDSRRAGDQFAALYETLASGRPGGA